MQTPQPIKRLYQRLRYGADGKQAKYARKAAERQRRFESERWGRAGDMAQRNYASYEEYLAHQAEKLDRIFDRRVDKDEDEYAEFLRRFRECEELDGAHNVLCLGARLGTEVKALLALGHFAVGIDLNPGPDNQWVMHGDFHKLVFADASVDAVYCNALDHVFDLPRVIAEVERVLRPGGVFVADVLPGYEEGFTPGEYEATHWRTVDVLSEQITAVGGLTEVRRRDHGTRRRDQWLQVVFERRGAQAEAGDGPVETGT